MNNRLTTQDLAGLLATKTGRTKKDSEQFIREFISAVTQGAFTDRLVKVKGLGTFKIIEVEDRESVNVNTGERFVIPGHFRFNFTPDKDLKELVNKPFSFFDTTEIEEGKDISELLTAETEEEIAEPEEALIPEQKEEQILEPEEEQIPEQKEAQIPESKEEVLPEIEESVEEPEMPEELPEVHDEPIAPSRQEDKESPSQEPQKPQKGKKNRGWLFVLWGIILLVIGIIGYKYRIYLQEIEQERRIEQIIAILGPEVQEEEQQIPIESEESVNDSIVVVAEEEKQPEKITVETPKILKTVKIEAGSRLTLIALEHYGNKIFWVYLYAFNKEKINDPNNIPIGTEIQVPSPEQYGINAKDRSSIEKASALQTEILTGKK